MYSGNKFRKGTKWDPQSKSLIWDMDQETLDIESNLNDEQRSMKIVATMSSDILDCLNFTWDSPTNNENGKMPVLDTQMWMGVERREKGIPKGMGEAPTVTKLGELKPIILFEFFKKPMANKCPNLMRSGLPESSKRATVTNEIHSRIKNTSRELEDDRITAVLTDYMSELAQGGYPLKWREEVLRAAIIGYRKIWANECNGSGFVNRPDHENKSRRRAAKLTGNSTWFQVKGSKTENQVQVRTCQKSTSPKSKIPPKIGCVLFCPYTPHSELRKLLQLSSFDGFRRFHSSCAGWVEHS